MHGRAGGAPRPAEFPPPRRPNFEPSELSGYTETYERANDPRLAIAQIAVRPGPFAITLEVPGESRGACHVRVFIRGEQDCAAGARPTCTSGRSGRARAAAEARRVNAPRRRALGHFRRSAHRTTRVARRYGGLFLKVELRRDDSAVGEEERIHCQRCNAGSAASYQLNRLLRRRWIPLCAAAGRLVRAY